MTARSHTRSKRNRARRERIKADKPKPARDVKGTDDRWARVLDDLDHHPRKDHR